MMIADRLYQITKDVVAEKEAVERIEQERIKLIINKHIDSEFENICAQAETRAKEGFYYLEYDPQKLIDLPYNNMYTTLIDKLKAHGFRVPYITRSQNMCIRWD
jgi:hypothetical protein